MSKRVCVKSGNLGLQGILNFGSSNVRVYGPDSFA